MDDPVSMVTYTAPVNIALIKYWGKRDEKLILPIASSLSITLDQEQMCAKTTVQWSKDFETDRFWLNGKEQSTNNERFQSCLKEIRNRTPLTHNYHVHICSSNNFPTAAGLASSAAGYACLVSALAKLFQVEGNISDLARLGSGSACRSVYGGFVEWNRGELEDGSDSVAHQVEPARHWPNLKVLVLVVNDQAKSIGSTEAMRNSVQTGQLVHAWAEKVVPEQISLIKEAISNRCFSDLGQLTMKASNQLHALCLETYPPVVYLNATSHSIIRLIHAFNENKGRVVAAYTFDAGPNACILTTQSYVPELADLFKFCFAPAEVSQEPFVRGLPMEHIALDDARMIALKANVEKSPGALKYIILTQLGEGPQQVQDHLLDSDGLPIQI